MDSRFTFAFLLLVNLTKTFSCLDFKFYSLQVQFITQSHQGIIPFLNIIGSILSPRDNQTESSSQALNPWQLPTYENWIWRCLYEGTVEYLIISVG